MARILRHAYIFLAFVFCSFEVTAAVRTIVVEPSQIQPAWSGGASGWSDSRNWNATVSTQAGSRISVPVVKSNSYGSLKIANALKNMLASE